MSTIDRLWEDRGSVANGNSFLDATSNIVNNIFYYIEDIFYPGRMKTCPNCTKRTIASFPTTTCLHCNIVFANNTNIVPWGIKLPNHRCYH